MIYREKQYNDTLCHFNPNHDPKTGQFTTSKGAKIARRIGGTVGALASGAAQASYMQNMRIPQKMAIDTYRDVNRWFENPYAPEGAPPILKPATAVAIARIGSGALVGAASAIGGLALGAVASGVVSLGEAAIRRYMANKQIKQMHIDQFKQGQSNNAK